MSVFVTYAFGDSAKMLFTPISIALPHKLLAVKYSSFTKAVNQKSGDMQYTYVHVNTILNLKPYSKTY